MAKYVRVASISFKGDRRGTVDETIETNVKEITRLLRKASLDKPDIICLPECSPFLGLTIEEMVKNAEKIPGTISDGIASFAKEINAHVIFPTLRKESNRVYNSAVLIDRNGEYIGSYNKVHPTIWEIEAGITPGTEAKAFELDFGKIGVAICFDLNFEDVIENLARDMIKIVFFSSMYPGGLQIKIWAFNYGVYMVSSIADVRESMVVNPLGRVLAVSSEYQPVICQDVNLDYEIMHLDYNYEKMYSIKEKYGPSISFETSRPEAVFLISSEAEGVLVKNVIEEFGLETRKEYFERASAIRERSLKSSTASAP